VLSGADSPKKSDLMSHFKIDLMLLKRISLHLQKSAKLFKDYYSKSDMTPFQEYKMIIAIDIRRHSH
jgi:hypothetical protein